jgi:hypothetical protein
MWTLTGHKAPHNAFRCPLESPGEVGSRPPQMLTTRLWPRNACRKADLPTPWAPTTLHMRTLRCVCPFSWSNLFSRVTITTNSGERVSHGGAAPRI